MKTLGEFYRENVLSQDVLTTIEWPYSSDRLEVIKDLFGWKLFSGKDFIECRSEEEAQYLKVFFEAGMKNVCVPENEEYLKNILPELEKLKIRIDEIVNSYLETVLNRKVREKVRYAVYMDLTK